MTAIPLPNAAGDLPTAITHLRAAAAAEKCYSCGCLRGTLEQLAELRASGDASPELVQAVELARSRLREVRYDCLGCPVCHPAEVANALNLQGATCTTAPVVERIGWPPLPGAYTLLRYRAPVAVCTLTDEDLPPLIIAGAGEEIALVGTLHTENLGIERLLRNMNANPHLRALILCGKDSRAAVGHLPGRSLVALAEGGIDEQRRIVGSPGARPYLKNISPESVERFRQTVRVHDRIGSTDPGTILDLARQCARESPGPAQAWHGEVPVPVIPPHLPQRTIQDPSGYCVIYADCARGLLSLEHYRNDGVLDAIVEGRTAAEVYTPALEENLISRMDHAAYLGRELARAEEALRAGQPYRQDAAPEAALCGCGSGRQCSPKPSEEEQT
jgi:tetrahydromethanopterin S-methyltransferase subunit A